MAREPEPGCLAPTPRALDRDRMLTVSALPATLGQRPGDSTLGYVEQSRTQGLRALQVGWLGRCLSPSRRGRLPQAGLDAAAFYALNATIPATVARAVADSGSSPPRRPGRVNSSAAMSAVRQSIHTTAAC
jgi:hypothetical protein